MRRGLSQQELADATERLGYPISRNTVMNIEGGRIETVTVQQIAVFAAALGEAPVELMFSIEDEASVEVIPGLESDPFHAAEWVSGRSWLEPDNEAEGVEVPAPLLSHWRLHDELVLELLELEGTIFVGSDDDVAEKRAETERRIAEQERLIQVFRAGMRSAGLRPPSLSDEYARLDRALPKAAQPLGRGITTAQRWLDGNMHQRP